MQSGENRGRRVERGSLSHRHLDSQDPAGVEIELGRHIDFLSVLHELGEVRCPDVVCIGGHDREEEVRIDYPVQLILQMPTSCAKSLHVAFRGHAKL
jgi:hypothetical protein